MKVETAERLTRRAVQISYDLNEIVRDVQADESDEEVIRLREAIRRVMWAVYFEILKPAFQEHPSLESESGAVSDPALEIEPRTPRSADRPSQPSAPGSRRPRQPRRSKR